MAHDKTCPVCGGPMVESGIVEGLGLIYMCDDDGCSSHDAEHDCKKCGHPTAFVWIEEDVEGSDDAGGGTSATGHWERRCFDPLCSTD